MKWVYKPEGMDERKWDFDPDDFTSTDAELIEKRTGLKFHEWVNEVRGGSITAAHALLFVLLRRDKPGLQWDSLVFKTREIGWEYTDQEVLDGVANLEARAAEGPLDDRESAVLTVLQADAAVRGLVTGDQDEPAEADAEDPTQPVSELESAQAKRKQKAS